MPFFFFVDYGNAIRGKEQSDLQICRKRRCPETKRNSFDMKARGHQGHEHMETMLDASSLILSVKQNVDEHLIRVIDRGNDSAWIKT